MVTSYCAFWDRLVSYLVNMGDQRNTDEGGSLRLSDIFTPEQDEQLAKLLAYLMEQKWGTLEIEIIKGKIRFFRPKPSIEVSATKQVLAK